MSNWLELLEYHFLFSTLRFIRLNQKGEGCKDHHEWLPIENLSLKI